jgi:hypothetical protein
MANKKIKWRLCQVHKRIHTQIVCPTCIKEAANEG